MLVARLAFALLVSLSLLPAPALAASFHAFESGPVRPMALSPDGSRLYVVNTPDNRLEIFNVAPSGITHADSVAVGMEPVAVAARSNSEIWVVNHLSDSISIVNDDGTPTVERTLLVGDEPRDIVFSGNGRAFITTAHRGQQRTHASISGVTGAGDPQLTTPSIGRADVWVFDPASLGATFGGTPLEIISLFGDTPRALAVSPDGNTVYAAVFHSGNQTAVVNEGMVCDGFAGAGACGGDGVTSPNGLGGGNLPGGNPGPSATVAGSPTPGVAAPEVGLVVQFDNASGEWRDELGRNWSNGIRFNLPDHDVFAINATTLVESDNYTHVGTILFNMVTNPVSGRIYVSNTDAQNLTRFEGPGSATSTVQGNLAQSNISVINPGTGAVDVRHLNKHINYSVLPAPAGTKDHSLATPVEMAVNAAGTTIYVAAFGSSKVGVLSTAALEADTFDPTVDSANYISVTGGGPGGLVLDEANGRLYVFTRFDNGVSVVDTVAGTESYHLNFPNPEPASITDGRFMLYDALATSSNGEASCSSCHVFGDFDSLAWDLGDPDGGVGTNPNTINLNVAAGDQNGGAANDEFHPMKGPMTTQTLRGMATSGHMHWRGDRADGFFGLDGPNNHDEDLSFRNFIVAFEGLVGDDVPATDAQRQADMQLFANFQLQVLLPPNPIRALDNGLNTDEQAGRDFFFGDHGGNDCSDGVCQFGTEGTLGFSCQGCHVLNPAQGSFGTDGLHSFENEVQIFKIPHLRNMYQKVGMFGMPNVPFNLPGYDNSHQGDQVRGTGFLHDGSTDTLFRFFTADVFEDTPLANAGFDGVGSIDEDHQRQRVEAFMMAFDSDLAPVVGQQVTLNATTLPLPDTAARLTLLEQSADDSFTSVMLGGVVTECDLIAKANIDGVDRGWLFDPALGVAGEYLTDTTVGGTVTRTDLETLAATPGREITFTCVPPGAGVRAGIDRDEDGALDFDEVTALTDPANPGSIVGACNDGIDNDGDGATDLADAGCLNLSSNLENPQCDDGANNDTDGLVDLADPNCASSADNREAPDPPGCGLMGIEAAPLLGLLGWRRRRSRRA